MSLLIQALSCIKSLMETPSSLKVRASSAMPPGLSLTVTVNLTRRPSAARPRSKQRPKMVVSILPPHKRMTTLKEKIQIKTNLNTGWSDIQLARVCPVGKYQCNHFITCQRVPLMFLSISRFKVPLQSICLIRRYCHLNSRHFKVWFLIFEWIRFGGLTWTGLEILVLLIV